jgi:hypothetical protein
MRRIIFSLLFILIAIGYLHAGLYNIEVPLTITDDIFFSNSAEVNGQLKELIDNNLKDINDEIAVVIFTRNGEPIKPLASMNDKINEKIKTPVKTDPPEDNDLYFVLKDDIEPWGDGQKADLRWFLYEVYTGGDDHGIYYAAKKLYGAPFFDYELNNYTIELYYNPYLPENVKAIWIPPTYWSDWDDIGPGKLYLRYYPTTYQQQGSNADNARGVLSKAMLMLFWGPFYNTFDQFISGMSYAGGTIMMNHFATIFDDFNDLFHGEKTEERPGFIFYENYNQPAISCQNINGTRFNDVDLRSYLAPYRFQMSEMAWYKVWKESSDGTYFQEFNKKMYDYGIEHTIYIPPIGPWYYDKPEYEELCKMADGAWDSSSSKPGPEGYDTFENWRNKQCILTEYPLRKYQLGVFSDEKKLRVCVYIPRNSGSGYNEQYPDIVIPIHVVISDNSNVYHNWIHYVGGFTNTDHFEVIMPSVPTLRKLNCVVHIEDGSQTFRFDYPVQEMDVIGGQPIQRDYKIMGVVPPDNTKKDFKGKGPTVWSIKDPENITHILNVQNWAFTLVLLNHPDGLEGTYQLLADGELYTTFEKDREIYFATGFEPPDQVDYDANNNGVIDEYEEPLVEKFAPILLFHKNNLLRPIPADIYLDNHDIKPDPYLLYKEGPLSDYEEFVRNDEEDWHHYFYRAKNYFGDPLTWYFPPYDWFLRLPMGSDEEGWYDWWWSHNGGFSNYPSTVYYHFFHWGYGSGKPSVFDNTYIQFYFFYPFNVWRNDHEGDWEQVMIKLDCQVPELAKPLAFNFHYHENVITFDKSSPYWDLVWGKYEGELGQDRFEVFVGGMWLLGDPDQTSGASYPHPTQWYGGEWDAAPGTTEVVEEQFHLFYPDCILPPTEHLVDHDYEIAGPYKYCQLNANKDNIINGELQEGDPEWLEYPGHWGRYYYCFWHPGDHCPSGPFYNEWEEWRDISYIESEEELNNIKELVEMKKLDEMNNNPSNIYNPYILDSSGGYCPSSELTTLDNTTYDISIYPNPCSNSATISIPQKLENDNEPITISIYDISGRLVRKEITTSSFTWDLTSSNGEPASNGIYFVNISTSKENKTLKLLVAR